MNPIGTGRENFRYEIIRNGAPKVFKMLKPSLHGETGKKNQKRAAGCRKKVEYALDRVVRIGRAVVAMKAHATA